MTIAQRTIVDFTAQTAYVGSDLLTIVNKVGTANANNKKITVTNFFANITANIGGSFTLTTTANIVSNNFTSNNGVTTNTLIVNHSNTPASNVAVPSVARHIWWDESYIYVVANTAANTIKRVALSNF